MPISYIQIFATTRHGNPVISEDFTGYVFAINSLDLLPINIAFKLHKFSIMNTLRSRNFSLIPERERVICAEGYKKEEREIGFQVRLVDLHKKYADFDESCLTKIGIRLFSKDRLTP